MERASVCSAAVSDPRGGPKRGLIVGRSTCQGGWHGARSPSFRESATWPEMAGPAPSGPISRGVGECVRVELPLSRGSGSQDHGFSPLCTAALSDQEGLWLQVRPLRHSIFAESTKS